MKSFKAGLPIALWMLRITTGIFLFHLCYFPISHLQFSQPEWMLCLIFLLALLMLIFCGFLKNPALTIFAGLFLCLLSGYKIFLLAADGIHLSDSGWLLIGFVGFFFFCYGNK